MVITMNAEEFEQLIAADPHLSAPLERAARQARRQQFSSVTEAAVIALLFPVARFNPDAGRSALAA